jgi:hypothetical protein
MGAPLKTPSNPNFKTTMTRDLALSLLRSGNNGDQILQILDSIVLGDSVDECDEYGAEPTLDAIDF